ncbi:Acetoin dehydrogenase operon transcriptional activator AcoR [Streptomyces sp. YIM 130001]|uniref:GAF domain-containing protein n=1 Tax=Streptomyces sp. YIM 130001 TaxID=2259644 RepID=UPI000E654908|nr:GAF domain-containing protein [Streptomyces sp. YIM 130001]RII17633.1 Acetoin dehydrogenase operon transcriptional activator AcoR [Streptomyces sp. YIM 130001]
MTNATIDLTKLAAVDSRRAARLLQGVRAATLSGEAPPVEPRPVIEESWGRMLRGGVDPEHDVRAGLLSLADLERRRRNSTLQEILPVLREGLVSIADAAHHIMVVGDADARVLWREGHPTVLHKADELGFELGADWRESTVGTNGVGTPLVARRPVQVFSAEHFVRSHHAWTCAGAPVTDPRNGRLIGVVDVSGPFDTMHPSTLALVRSVARLAEAELRNRHLAALDRLRTVAVPLLSRTGGRALVVDSNGWPAAVHGMSPVDRVVLPKGFGPGDTSVPGLGECAVEPLPGGWLLRLGTGSSAHAGASRVVLDLGTRRTWTITVSGASGSWTHELSPRHAELLYLLAADPSGRTAAGLAEDVFGDPSRAVTVRAELSRVRRYLAGVLAHRPYRFHEDARVEVVLPGDPAALLPHSTAPAVVRARAGGGSPR